VDDPYLRYLLFHKPFWHDWLVSAGRFDMSRWSDGGDFLVNYIGHPMQGGVTGNIYIQNDPRARASNYASARSTIGFDMAHLGALFQGTSRSRQLPQTVLSTRRHRAISTWGAGTYFASSSVRFQLWLDLLLWGAICGSIRVQILNMPPSPTTVGPNFY
jgi:hypothetical protein